MTKTLVVSMIALLASVGSAQAVIASVTVVDPLGGEIWNGVHTISWTTSPAFDPATVNIYLVDDSDSSVKLIATGEVNDGSYSWDTTTTQAGLTVAGTQYRIRVASSIDTNIKDDSNTTFEIDNIAPVLNPITSVVSDAAPVGVLQIGDSITFSVSATTTEPGATVTGSYNGVPLVWSTSNSGVSYTGTYIVASGHTDQSSALQISGVTMRDHASLGNVSSAGSGSDVVVTIDANRPTLSSVAITSNHTNTSYAKTGSTVTVSFTSNEAIATPTVTIAGNPAVVSGGPTSWTAAYTFVGTEAEGVVPFSISYADISGNTALSTATATTNASSVTYDKTLPTVTSITTKDADANGSVDRATVVFSESVDDASFSAGAFTIGGNVGTSIVTGTANDNTFDVLLTTQVTGTDVKDVTYTAGTGADRAGNLLASVGSGGIVEIDGAGPIMISALTTSTTTITVTFSEDLDGATDAASDFTVAGVTVSGTSELAGVITVTTTAFGTGATPLVSLVGNGVQDLPGVTSPAGQTITPVDGVAPTIVSITSSTANGSYNNPDPINITITFSEAITSAGGVTVNLDTTGSCTTGALSNTTTGACSYVIADGHNSADLNDASVTGTIADQASNALTNFVPATSLATGHAIVVDTTEPVITALTLTAGGACTGSLCGVGDTITVGLTADAAGYTIGTITVNGVAVTGFTDNGGGSYSATYTLVEGNTDRSAGTVPVSATVVDLAGNVTSPAFTTVTVNTVAVDANTPAAPTGITLTDPINLANGTSVTVSGSGEANATANWSIDDTTIGSPVAGSTPIVGFGAFSNGGINVSALLDGSVTATVTVTDAAGNTSTSATDVVLKDVVVPTIAPTGIVGATVQGAGDTITITFSESVSPVDATWSSNEFSSIQSPDGTALDLTGAGFAPSTGSTTTLTITLGENVLSTTTYLRNGDIVAVTPGLGTIQDVALNPMAITEVVGTPVITGDVVAPTVAFTYSPDRKVGDADTVTITATFNESIHEAVIPTIAIATPGDGDVSATSMTKTSNTIWTYNWNVPAGYDDDGTATVTIVAQDLAGNANATATNNTRIIDNTQPQALTASPIGSSVAIANATATITMSETVWLVDSSRIMLVNDATNASHAGVITSAGTNAVTVAYSGLVNGTTYRINMIPGAVRDEALNLSGVVGPLYFTTVIDLIAPVVNSLSAGTITPTGAVLSLTTDENASCRYATTDSAFGSMTAFTTTGGTSHSVSLAGLTSSTVYSYYVRCQDASAQLNTMTTSAHVAFTTATPDTTGPVVSNVQATSITATGATITWATNELATSRIEYGATSAYGSLTTADGEADLTSHSVALSGLTSATEYHYRILSSDALGNATVSGDNTFTTLTVADTTAPAIPAITTGAATIDADQYMIAGTVADDGGTRTVLLYNGATLAGSVVVPAGQTSWSLLTALNQVATNVFTATAADNASPANVSGVSTSVTITEATTIGDTTAPAVPAITTGAATVDADQYTITGTAGADLPTDGTRVITITRSGTVVGSLSLPAGETDWSFTSPLLQGTTNVFSVTSTDVAGNTSTASSTVTITEADTTAPVISSIQPVSIAQTTATITWTTNESSTTTVEYGLTGSYGSTATTGGSATSHAQGLTGLTAGTEYHYRVRSIDGAGNESISDDATFTTSASTADVSEPIVSNIQAGAITTSGATITWATNELATSRIEYGTTSTYGSFTALDGVADLTSHSVALSGLTAGTEYHYRVISSDAVGNTTTSGDQTFTTSATAADVTAPVAPVITTSAATVDANTYSVAGTVTAESTAQTVTVYNGATAVATVVVPASQTSWSVTVSLTQSASNAFTATSTDASGNVSGASNTVTITEAEGAVSLAVTSIGATKTLATADDSYTNGWEWEFLVTVPTAEASLSMKFDNFVSGANTLLATGNMRFYSAQSSNASTSSSAISITGALAYAGPLVLTGDLDSVTAGRQIKIVVQTKVPAGTASGSYSTSYGIKSN